MPTATSTAFPRADAPSASPPDSTPIPSTMPPGSTFDILPPALHALSALLASPSLLLLPPAGAAGATAAEASGPAGAAASGSGAASAPADPSLRDLPDLIIAAKQRVQNAKAVVARLPDVDRTIAQQEAEIKRVEARIERLKEAWAEIQAAARLASAGKGDTVMADELGKRAESNVPDADVEMDEG